MTRKRIGSGLLEAFSETCDLCKGRGVLIHTEPVPEKRTTGAVTQVKAVAAASRPEPAAPAATTTTGGGRSRRRRGGGGSSEEPAIEVPVLEAGVVDAEVIEVPVA